MEPVRLSEFYIETICSNFRKCFGPEDHLWIFGSRIDMHQKGGDIDLYIKTMQKDVVLADKMRMKFSIELWKQLGEQKIDIVLNIYPFQEKLSIYKVAEQGVLLV